MPCLVSVLLPIVVITIGLGDVSVYGQVPVRPDDEFLKQRYILRIILDEKLNEPLYKPEKQEIVKIIDPKFEFREGMVRALLDGFEQNKYTGYSPDNLALTMSYAKLKADLEKYNCDEITPPPGVPGGGSPAGGDPFGGGFGDPFGGGGDPFGGGMDFGGSFDFGGGASITSPAVDAKNPASSGAGPCDKVTLYYGTEVLIHLIEDRIFDKNKSSMTYIPQYICLFWVDPRGSEVDRPIVCFQYEDVLDQLESTKWVNRWNDAECRSMHEVLTLRLFNCFAVNVSGTNMKILTEAKYFTDKVVEFEHHLWEY